MKRKVSILGGGESGIGAALLAKKMNEDVFLSDFGKITEERKEELIKYKIPFEEEGHTFEILVQADLVIKSPGIKDDVTIIQQLKAEDIEIISEIEFAYRANTGKIIAITGSNGKTTTTHLIYHLLLKNDYSVAEVGNVGKSFARQLFEEEKDYYVVEVSSFQLDGTSRFRPDIAILLNITPDHLDRYEYDIERYAASKFRISKFQLESDVLIYYANDPGIANRITAKEILSKKDAITEESLGIDGAIQIEDDWTINVQDSNLMGRHNQVNLLAGIKAVRHFGLTRSEIENVIGSFKNEPHRLEIVGEKNGVLFINDSKATNVDAVYFALEAMTRPVIWIAGGTDKGNAYEALFAQVENKVKALICLGVNNEKLKEAFLEKIVEIRETEKVDEAVKWAQALAVKGDVVLLSPACASFDLFQNYKHRGEEFIKQVQVLIEHKE